MANFNELTNPQYLMRLKYLTEHPVLEEGEYIRILVADGDYIIFGYDEEPYYACDRHNMLYPYVRHMENHDLGTITFMNDDRDTKDEVSVFYFEPAREGAAGFSMFSGWHATKEDLFKLLVTKDYDQVRHWVQDDKSELDMTLTPPLYKEIEGKHWYNWDELYDIAKDFAVHIDPDIAETVEDERG